MKPFATLLISVLLLSSTFTLAQEQNFGMFPQSGKKYIYKYNESTFIKTKEGEKLNKYVKTKVFENKGSWINRAQ